MGADLYIESLPENTRKGGFEVSKSAVQSGYFRDCYNSYGLFAVVSVNTGHCLSWWLTAERKDLFPHGGNIMSYVKAKAWLAELKPIFKQFKQQSKIYASDYDLEKHKSIKGKKIKDAKEYHDWCDLLVEFLELAIKLKSTIYFSV